MDILLIILGALLMFFGLLGCILPIIPGPPLSFVGLLVLHFTKRYDLSFTSLAIFAVLAIAVTVLDYIVPVWGTKKFGGSSYGSWGSIIGLILGIFFLPPLGIIIGPFIGAVIGEVIGGKEFGPAMKAGLGSFIGFLLGTGLKLIVSITMTVYFVRALF